MASHRPSRSHPNPSVKGIGGFRGGEQQDFVERSLGNVFGVERYDDSAFRYRMLENKMAPPLPMEPETMPFE